MSEDETVERRYSLRQIYFYLTEGCNLACRHCWLAPKYQTEEHLYPSLDFDLFRSILEQAKPLGVTTVKLTGGEPLMHPRIHDILESIQMEGYRRLEKGQKVEFSIEDGPKGVQAAAVVLLDQVGQIAVQ